MKEIKNRISVEYANGYICKLTYNQSDLIHGGSFPEKLKSKEDKSRIEKGAPEYSNITGFPFGGIPKKVFYEGREITRKERHGLSRSLPWEDISNSDDKVTFRQICDGQTLIRNIKYDASKGNSEFLDPMFPFEIYRSYEIIEKGVIRSRISISATRDFFKYSLWDHPIFISPQNLEKGSLYFEYNNKESKVNLSEVSKLEKNVMLLDGIENITFINEESGVCFKLESKGFGNLMIWSPEGKGVFSIESKSHQGIENEFPSANSKLLNLNSPVKYFVDITPLFKLITPFPA